MTINAPAAWLLSLYTALLNKALQESIYLEPLKMISQKNIYQEALHISTGPSLKLTSDIIKFTTKCQMGSINMCSYHLQEVEQHQSKNLSLLQLLLEFLNSLRSEKITNVLFEKLLVELVFVNSGMRFITETSKMIAFTELWDEICKKRLK